MRGKNIIWLSVIALLLGVIAAPVVAPVGNTRVFIDPSLVYGHPEGSDNTFVVELKVSTGKDVYGWGIDIQIVALERVITPIAYEEGSFLKAPGVDTYWQLPAYDKINGIIHIGCTRLGDTPGVDGDGTLAKITFQVLEAGNSPLDLVATKLIDSYGNLSPHAAVNGEYQGPVVNLVMKELPLGRSIAAGVTQVFMAKIKNEGDVPLLARVRWDLVREDGVMYNVYAGQNMWTTPPPSVYLYCNGATNNYGNGWGWVREGNAPYLNAVGDGNYVWGPDPDIYWLNATENDMPAGFPIVGRFDFEDLPLAGRAIAKVTLEAYTKYDYYDADNDLDTYAKPMGETGPTTWIGSEWGTADWGWHTVRWTAKSWSEYAPQLLTQAGIDAARIRYFMYWTFDGGPHGRAYIDAIRLKVDFSPISPVTPPYVIIEPHQMLQMPVMQFFTAPEDVGQYYCTCFADFRYFPPPPSADYAQVWNRGVKVSSFKMQVLP